MPRHLGLDFHQFLASVPADLIDRYLERFQIQHPSRPYFGFNVAALEAYLADPPDPETAALIAADLRRINDVSNETLGLLARAYQKYLIPFDPKLNHAHLAMRLFLDHPEAFDFAWSRYLLFATEACLSMHHTGSVPRPQLPREQGV